VEIAERLRKKAPGRLDLTPSAWEKIKRHIELVGKNISAFLINTKHFLTRPRVVFILGVMLIGLSALSVHYYTVLSSEIDARLRGNFFDGSVGIFTAPLKVSIGDRLSSEEVKSYLNAAGYQQKPASDRAERDGSYTAQGDVIEIVPSRLSSERLGLIPVRITFDRNERVKSVVNLSTGKTVSAATIEGEMLESVRNGDRIKKTVVTFSDIPPHLRDALLAVEDRRFFSHSGIDLRGVIRAFWTDLHEGQFVQGGSTITQQLIKNSLLSSDRTLTRKFKEAAMALILEFKLSKEDIFNLYCNEVYLGQDGAFAIHGFAQASEVYFGKGLSELTLAESAFLAGLVHAPNRYSPGRDLTRLTERRNRVLDSMVEMEVISSQEAEEAKKASLSFRERKAEDDFGAGYFVDYVQDFLTNRYGENAMDANLKLHTTMDPRLQRAAYETLSRHTARLDRFFARPARKGDEPAKVQGAIVALDAHTGEVLAMVGGRNYEQTQLNRATDARRQPGSTFKPFVYASALGTRSYTAASLISDRPQKFSYDGGRKEYEPSNYHGGFTNRDVTLREALARSMNVPAVELAMRVGLGQVAELAEESGFEGLRAYPSLALGTSEVTPLQLAGAYTAFANGGIALRPVPVKSIDSSDETAGAAQVRATSVRVLSPEVAYLMTDLMQSVVEEGTASRLRSLGVRGAIAGKTGTSNDGWFVGYTPNMVCVVWVGMDDNRDLRMKASDSAMPIWADFVREAIDLRPDLGGTTFHKPAGIVTAEIDPTTGYLAGPDCPERRQEIFISGTEPWTICSHTNWEEDLPATEDGLSTTDEGDQALQSPITVEVCAQTGLLASSACPSVTRKTVELKNMPDRLCDFDHQKAAPEPGDSKEILIPKPRSGRPKKPPSKEPDGQPPGIRERLN
jgi:penicillin-binding protein 1B